MYLLPGEFIALISFLFLPPVLLAFAGQVWWARQRLSGWASLGRLALAFGLTLVLSIALAFGIDQLAPRSLTSVLRVREFHRYPILPLAFVVVALVAPPITLAIFRRKK